MPAMDRNKRGSCVKYISIQSRLWCLALLILLTTSESLSLKFKDHENSTNSIENRTALTKKENNNNIVISGIQFKENSEQKHNGADDKSKTALETQQKTEELITEEERQIIQLKNILREHHLKCLIAAQEDQPTEYGCERAWDSVICWPPTSPSTWATSPCPDHVPNLNVYGKGKATRWCEEGGNWSAHPDVSPNSNNGTNETVTETKPISRFYQGWTNYSQCLHSHLVTPEIDPLTQEWLPVIQKISIVGYSVSLVTLLISFAILISIRKLRCPRNMLHLHLFASFIMRATVVLLRRSIPNEQNDVGCRIMVVLWQYFIAANHSWILMEGLYLHNLIFRALFTDSSAILPYVLMGWGMPAIMVTIWSILRVIFDDSHCWLVHNNVWIFWTAIRVPTTSSVFVNLFFFINILRVLATKLNSSTSDSTSVKYRKLAKSTLVLVPLFGIHYCLLWGLSTSTFPPVELAYLMMDQGCSSFQGFFVAILYCLMNGEVKQELKKTYNKYHGNEDNGYLTTYSTVMSNTRSYVSRARLSLHSIHTDESKKDGGGMHRSGGGREESTSPCRRLNSPSPTPPNGKELYEMKSIQSYNKDQENNSSFKRKDDGNNTLSPNPGGGNEEQIEYPAAINEDQQPLLTIPCTNDIDTKSDDGSHHRQDSFKKNDYDDDEFLKESTKLISIENSPTHTTAVVSLTTNRIGNHNNNYVPVMTSQNNKSESLVKLNKNQSIAIELMNGNINKEKVDSISTGDHVSPFSSKIVTTV